MDGGLGADLDVVEDHPYRGPTTFTQFGAVVVGGAVVFVVATTVVGTSSVEVRLHKVTDVAVAITPHVVEDAVDVVVSLQITATGAVMSVTSAATSQTTAPRKLRQRNLAKECVGTEIIR